jgi:hypothetical protein
MRLPGMAQIAIGNGAARTAEPLLRKAIRASAILFPARR